MTLLDNFEPIMDSNSQNQLSSWLDKIGPFMPLPNDINRQIDSYFLWLEELYFGESTLKSFTQGIEIRYSAHSSFTLTSLLTLKNLSKLVLLRDEMPCR